MAGGFIALLDDIAGVLDDVAALSKAAAKKTIGVVGDDLAVNAEQLNGIAAKRELPIVWAVAKGSLVNKALIIPVCLGLSAWAPALLTPLLMAGGAYLCFEGVEKVLENLPGSGHKKHEGEDLDNLLQLSGKEAEDLEKDKIKGAIKTDFVLSLEIMMIALNTVAPLALAGQLAALATIGAGMTAFVYGLVAGIVKLDDAGFWLKKKQSPLAQKAGEMLVAAAPKLMKGLTVAGTIAMFSVGGGIVAHGIPALAGLAHGGLAGFGVDLGAGVLAGVAAAGLAKAAGFAKGAMAKLGFAGSPEPGPLEAALEMETEAAERSAQRSLDAAAKAPGAGPAAGAKACAAPLEAFGALAAQSARDRAAGPDSAAQAEGSAPGKPRGMGR